MRIIIDLNSKDKTIFKDNSNTFYVKTLQVKERVNDTDYTSFCKTHGCTRKRVDNRPRTQHIWPGEIHYVSVCHWKWSHSPMVQVGLTWITNWAWLKNRNVNVKQRLKVMYLMPQVIDLFCKLCPCTQCTQLKQHKHTSEKNVLTQSLALLLCEGSRLYDIHLYCLVSFKAS